MKFIWLVVIVLAFSCEKKPRKQTFVGIPPGALVTCGPRYHDYQLECVAAGRAYSCVSDRPLGCDRDETINCGVLGAPVPEPEPPQYVPPPEMPPTVTMPEPEEEHARDMPMLRPSGVPGTSSGFSWW